MEMDYQSFLKQKAQLENNHGFTPTFMPDWMFDFQKDITTWAITKGRGALLHDRKAIGIELKDSYYRQAVKNVSIAGHAESQDTLF